MKTDHTIRNICLAAIKRHTIKPIDFLFTSLFETELVPEFPNGLAVLDGELPVARTFIDNANWTFVTTKRVVICDRERSGSHWLKELNPGIGVCSKSERINLF
jgi:hypothetical protein